MARGRRAVWTFAAVVAASGDLHRIRGLRFKTPGFDRAVWRELCELGWPGLRVPFAGGVYLRVLPFALVRHWFRRRLAVGDPIAGYAHPYDIDVDQEAFMFPEINDSRFYNWLMYRNRDQVFPRLEKLFATGVRVTTYRDFVDGDLAGRAAHA